MLIFHIIEPVSLLSYGEDGLGADCRLLCIYRLRRCKSIIEQIGVSVMRGRLNFLGAHSRVKAFGL